MSDAVLVSNEALEAGSSLHRLLLAGEKLHRPSSNSPALQKDSTQERADLREVWTQPGRSWLGGSQEQQK